MRGFILSLLFVVALAEVSAADPLRFDAEAAWEYLERQVEFGPRAPGTEGHESCASWLIGTLRGKADLVEPHVFFQPDPYSDATLKLTNIKASFRPEATHRIALGAHWDTRPRADRETEGDPTSPIPGANDGASGVAVLLAVADALAEHPAPIGVDLLFFDGEDWGREGEHQDYLLGSRRFVQDFPSYRPAALILLDMVGDKDLRIPMEAFSHRGAPHLLRTVFARAGAMGLAAFEPIPGAQVYDDHIPFLQKGIPAIDLIDFEYDAWHTLGDDASQCSKESLGQVGDLLLHLLHVDLVDPAAIR